MKTEYELMHENFITLEWIISEMELKIHELKAKNPNFDSSDSVKKINSLKSVQSFVYETYEKNNKVLIKNKELEFLNSKLKLLCQHN